MPGTGPCPSKQFPLKSGARASSSLQRTDDRCSSELHLTDLLSSVKQRGDTIIQPGQTAVELLFSIPPVLIPAAEVKTSLRVSLSLVFSNGRHCPSCVPFLETPSSRLELIFSVCYCVLGASSTCHSPDQPDCQVPARVEKSLPQLPPNLCSAVATPLRS